MNKKRIIMIAAAAVSIALLLSSYLFFVIEKKETNPHDHYNALEDWWIPIGASPDYMDEKHSFQTIVVGDLFGNGSRVALTNYHHGQCGVFLNTNYGGTWEKEFLHPKFVRGTEKSGGWRIKGLVGGDIDNDGYKEIITCADVVSFPLEGERYHPFPGVIFMDLNEPGTVLDPQPLVWGNWGEEIANRDFASLVPSIISPVFRNRSNRLPDIMVMTSTEFEGMSGSSRLFLLEQPDDGFNDYNYTYTTPQSQGVYPYDEEAFYVKHLYVDRGGIVDEMVFTPDQWHPQLLVDSSTLNGFGILDINDDGLMDLAVSVEYWQGGTVIGSDVFLYKRIESADMNYLFEEVDRIRSEGSTYSGIAAANLDGKGGREALVLASKAAIGSDNKSIANYITIDNERMTLHTLDLDVDSEEYPYNGCYANTLVVDVDRDGYDDIIVYGVYKNMKIGEAWGDVICFRNTGGELSENRFIYDEKHTRVLMKGQSPSWSLTMQQCDDDDDPELVVCVQNELPFWEKTEESEAHVYYCNLYDIISE